MNASPLPSPTIPQRQAVGLHLANDALLPGGRGDRGVGSPFNLTSPIEAIKLSLVLSILQEGGARHD